MFKVFLIFASLLGRGIKKGFYLVSRSAYMCIEFKSALWLCESNISFFSDQAGAVFYRLCFLGVLVRPKKVYTKSV